MQAEHDATMLVRTELCERLESLQRLSYRRSRKDLTESIRSIRRLAAAYGLTPVVRLAEALERAAVEDGPRRCATALYLDRLHDAIGCDSNDEQTSQAMIASVSVRLGA
jgi:hypothetical protein